MSVAQQQALGLGPRKHGSLEVHMIPSIYDNYIFVLRETGANKVAVVDPSEDMTQQIRVVACVESTHSFLIHIFQYKVF